MPAKTLADLPDDAIIEVRTHDNGRVDIMAVNDQNETYYLLGEDTHLLGIQIEKKTNPVTGQEMCRSLSCTARHGFGPLGYDLAIEFASSNGRCGLLTGTGLNENSKPVWEFYRDKRPDVIHTAFAPDHPWLKSRFCDPEFPFALTKPVLLFPQLEASGRIKYVHGSSDLLPEALDLDDQVDEQLEKLFGGEE
jgi:hypothetical protein